MPTGQIALIVVIAGFGGAIAASAVFVWFTVVTSDEADEGLGKSFVSLLSLAPRMALVHPLPWVVVAIAYLAYQLVTGALPDDQSLAAAAFLASFSAFLARHVVTLRGEDTSLTSPEADSEPATREREDPSESSHESVASAVRPNRLDVLDTETSRLLRRCAGSGMVRANQLIGELRGGILDYLIQSEYKARMEADRVTRAGHSILVVGFSVILSKTAIEEDEIIDFAGRGHELEELFADKEFRVDLRRLANKARAASLAPGPDRRYGELSGIVRACIFWGAGLDPARASKRAVRLVEEACDEIVSIALFDRYEMGDELRSYLPS